ncbi:pentatricopeptide repeat-containing protein At3g24000, mitochondrial [Cryptomeria japonica]|uniref:pentatricopeptide repeat-containing protein At3g24000, mitochondrial n=1 Tax=Cryptomeria japonica TaxID=3369 RepID=UPI0027D9DAFB|nr:pentatricopeptide repeat-containing protein At3g24000, mitochondrial [Cryptomeria japonica]
MAALLVWASSWTVTSSSPCQTTSLQIKHGNANTFRGQFLQKQRSGQFKVKGVAMRETALMADIDENYHVTKLCKQGLLKEALHHLQTVGKNGTRIYPGTYGSLLNLCLEKKALPEAQMVHEHMITNGIKVDRYLGNYLINVYSKLGRVEVARKLFDEMSDANFVSWSSMIGGYAQNGFGPEALQVFCRMLEANFFPNKIILASVFRACSNISMLETGKQVYAYVIKSGDSVQASTGCAVVNMFMKCGLSELARTVFDRLPEKTVMTWTAMIVGYIQNKNESEALRLFCEMLGTGMELDQFVFSSVLRACGSTLDLHLGKQMHGYIVKYGFQSDVSSATPLVDMYAKCNRIEDARQVFDRMSERNVVSWCAMMAGYVDKGDGEEALNIFKQMQRAGMKPNQFVFSSLFDACAKLAALEQGKQVHANFIKRVSNPYGEISLVNMYSRSGTIDDAQKIFNRMPERDVVAWTTLIVGYAQHGLGREALELFEKMQVAGVKPNHITFVGVLSACSHMGLVDEGWEYFNSMNGTYGIEPTVDHYACMVDILGRAGCLEEAEDLINQMPFEPNALVWRTLLGACRVHGNMELGKRAAECILKLEPEDDATYILLANMNSSIGNWDEAANIRKVMNKMGIKKKVGRSWIEVKNKVHTFVASDRSHPQTEEIYGKLDSLIKEMKEIGYVPDTSSALHDVEEHQKEHLVCHHSEKLAIAFGLISIAHDSPVLVFKNLRVCSDCHTASKLISKIEGREIVVRDAYRFHHFKDGVCSCKDYW